MYKRQGQGALGIEVRIDRTDVMDALRPLAHVPTWLAVSAERAVSRALGGSCSVPLAAHAVWQGERLWLRAAWGEISESTGEASLVQASGSAAAATPGEAEALGQSVAAELLRLGARPPETERD